MSASAAVPELDPLFARLEGENSEIRFSQYSLAMKEQNLRATRSLLLPNLTFNVAASKSRDLTIRTSDFTTSDGQSADSQASALGLPTTVTRSTDGWLSQFSTTYYLFTHFAVSEAIGNAKISIESANYTLNSTRLGRRAQFVQGLMEWQWLNSLVKPLEDARAVVKKVKDYARQRSNVLYSENDRADLDEKENEFNYHWVRVNEGLSLIENALKDQIPSLTHEELSRLPRIGADYALPEGANLRTAYIERSLGRKILENDVKISEGNYRVARWSRPWVPVVALSAGISNYGGYDGKNTGNSWSSQILMNFNLFDGFYTDARRAQASIGLSSTEDKRDAETSKMQLALQARRMKALVARSEFSLKSATEKKKRLRFEDVEKKRSRGLITDLELTLASLDYVKAKMDTLDALKDYQSASLGIAVELNDWERVNIYETKHE